MVLQPIGCLIKADVNGVLPRIGRPPHATWRPILDDISERLQDMLAPGFSLIVRGSVARGASVEQAADLDLVILHDAPSDLPDDLSSTIKPDLKVETSMIASDDVRTGADWAWMRFMLTHNGYTLRGPDLLAGLPEPSLGPHCCIHLRNADQWLEDWQTYWKNDKDYPEICEWLMKRIVRALSESQFMKIGAYSRDIYPCATMAIEAFPDQRSAILDAAELAIAPTADYGVIAEITDRLAGTILSAQVDLRNLDSIP